MSDFFKNLSRITTFINIPVNFCISLYIDIYLLPKMVNRNLWNETKIPKDSKFYGVRPFTMDMIGLAGVCSPHKCIHSQYKWIDRKRNNLILAMMGWASRENLLPVCIPLMYIHTYVFHCNELYIELHF